MNVKKNTKENLTENALLGNMPDVRSVVVAEIEKQKVTAYEMAKTCGLTQQAIRNYMVGKSDMRVEKLSLILAALGMEIRIVKSKRTGGRVPR